jgi:hypothetical protein
VKEDLDILMKAIGPNIAFFKQLVRFKEEDVIYYVQGMNTDQLMALDRLRAGDTKQAVRDFQAMCVMHDPDE